MEEYTGKAIFRGIAIGKVCFYEKGEQMVKRGRIENAEEEIARYERAREKAVQELGALYDKALKEVGEVNAAIFEVHAMMLDDDDYNDSVKNIITSQKVNAEYAVAATGDNFSKMFSGMEDDYFRARAADVKDISERVVSILTNRVCGRRAGYYCGRGFGSQRDGADGQVQAPCLCDGARILQFPHGDPGQDHEHSGADRHSD